MFDWFNSNEGFIMSILTFVYVLATIVIVIMNLLSIKEMKKSRLDDSRPYIMANIVKDPRDKVFYIRIKNYGKTGAIIESFDVNPDLNLVKENNQKVDIKGCLFPPEYVVQFIILEPWEKTCQNDYSIKLSYKSVERNSRSFSEEYKLVTQYAHLQGYTDNAKSNLNDVDNAIVNISNCLDSIRNKL